MLTAPTHSLMPTFVHYVPPPRYVAWIDPSSRRIVCACGHAFRADYRLHDLREGTIRCKGAPGRACDRLLLLMSVRDHDKKMIAEVTEADLAFIQAKRMLAETQLAYLFSTAPRAA
jgi:hypothetical protein